MRPVRLTLQAFGPYAQREVIDFRNALEAGLFGIYGQTGSGKSTIFSGMTFALFGEASRAEQDRASLRSDHADAGLVTEVEFVFDIGERRFVVVRQPEQMRPKQRGGGETRSPHEAFLYEATGLDLEQIEPDRRGKIIAEKKVGEVRSAVEDLLGYGPEQFRQIVLLPQGRFERFLSAKTSDRLAILRDLFDVSLYQGLMTTLKEQADAAEQHVREERALCARQLLAEGFADAAALLAGIGAAETGLTDSLAGERAASQRAVLAQTRLQEGETQQARLLEAERAETALADLTAREPEFEALAHRAEQAARARLVLDLETQARTAAGEMRAAQAQCDAAAQGLSLATTLADEAGARLVAEEARAPLIESARQQKDELQRYAGILEAASASAAKVDDVLAAQRQAALALEAARLGLSALRDARLRSFAALKAARETQACRTGLAAQHDRLSGQLEAARAWETAEAELAMGRTQLESQQGFACDAAQVEQAARRRFEEAETALASAHALALAARLKAGLPCPVCGAADHPAPASGDVALSAPERTFKEVRKTLQQAEQMASAARENLSVLKAMVADREARHARLRQPEQTSQVLSSQISETQAALEALGPAVDLTAAEQAVEAIEERIGHLDGQVEQLREQSEQLSRDAAAASARHETRLAEIPAYLRSSELLDEALARTCAQLDALITAREAARQADRTTRDAALAARAALDAARKIADACEERLEKSQQAFRLRLSELGFTQESYQAAKPAIDTYETDRGSVADFTRRLNEAEGAARAARAAIQGIARPDLDALRAEHEAAAAASDAATQTRIAAMNRLTFLTDLQARIEDTLQRLDEAEAASGPLRRLAALVGGDNPLSLRLETFALAAMFDQVLEAANLRLGPMTSWRYRMERSVEGGRGSRGLGIEVFDAHTGKSRATETLSGGETFIAALALALGLADIVETANGRIRLDTIFIDEGFGSLDTENGSGTLDQVLQVLGGLVRQSRAVGLISHVPLVQEAIPNGFYVRKGPCGSRIEARGLD